MTTYFISDLHLSPARPELVHAFFNFLQSDAKNAEALYILGDFFDAWIGDDEDNKAVTLIKNTMKAYSSKGVECFFMHGNRDFLIGKQFEQETGFNLVDEGTVIDLYGEPTLLIHGDSLCTADTAYMQFRAMVRSAQWQAQVLSLPLDQRRQMAAQLRDQSQSMSAMKADDIMDVTPSEVVKLMEEKNVQCLIHGHTHRPATHDLDIADKAAKRIVLGDWGETGWAIKASSSFAPTLYEFPLV